MKSNKLLIALVKIVASLGIIGFLLYQFAGTPEARADFWRMLHQPKDTLFLVSGLVTLLLAIFITMLRWWYLVRALDIALSLSSALRIGFIGYLFNFAPLGIVTGDLVKALMLALEYSGSRAKALASVVVDRVIGLYVLFLVATAGVFVTGFWYIDDATVHWLCSAVLTITFVSTIGIALVLIPGFLETRLMQSLTRIPKIGGAIESLLDAVRIYRDKRLVLFLSSLMTTLVHGLLATSLCLFALGLRFDQPVPPRDYLAIYPIPGIFQAIPIPFGPTESVIVYCYENALLHLPEIQSELMAAKKPYKAKELRKTGGQQGLFLAIVYRLGTIVLMPIGAAYYFLGGRSEVQEVMHEAEEGDADGNLVDRHS